MACTIYSVQESHYATTLLIEGHNVVELVSDLQHTTVVKTMILDDAMSIGFMSDGNGLFLRAAYKHGNHRKLHSRTGHGKAACVHSF